MDLIFNIMIMIVTIYMWIVIIQSLLTWFQPDPRNPIIKILSQLTEPVYYKIKQYIPTTFNGLDLTPLVIILILQFIKIFLVNMLG